MVTSITIRLISITPISGNKTKAYDYFALFGPPVLKVLLQLDLGLFNEMLRMLDLCFEVLELLKVQPVASNYARFSLQVLG